jgi:hypothetical protein
MSKRREGEVVPAIGTAKGGWTVRESVSEIVPDAHDKMKMDVAICTAGVFYTEDGGRSWQPRNRGTRADFLPDRHPEIRQCVHKLLPAADGKRLYQQNHCDVHQSDSSRGWRDSARMIR